MYLQQGKIVFLNAISDKVTSHLYLLYLWEKKRILSENNHTFSIVLENHNMVDLYNINHQWHSSLIVNVGILPKVAIGFIASGVKCIPYGSVLYELSFDWKLYSKYKIWLWMN